MKVKGWKLILGASLLAQPMKPEEATNTQDIVGICHNMVALYDLAKLPI